MNRIEAEAVERMMREAGINYGTLYTNSRGQVCGRSSFGGVFSEEFKLTDSTNPLDIQAALDRLSRR